MLRRRSTRTPCWFQRPRAFYSLGAASVTIAEGPGHRRMTLDMAEAAGFFSAVPRFEDRFIDLNTDDVRRVTLAGAVSTLKELYPAEYGIRLRPAREPA